MTVTYSPFDVADYLENHEVMAEYLAAALEDPNPDVFRAALGDAVRSAGLSHGKMSKPVARAI